MPTGSRKTTVYQFLRSLLTDIRSTAGCTVWLLYINGNKQFVEGDGEWLLQDATFEKMGAHMADKWRKVAGSL